MNCSFPKESRLLNSKDFNYLRRGAYVLNTPFLRLYYKKSMVGETSRLGMSISKKAGNAVMRNYIKRRIREYYRQNLQFKQSFQDKDVLIISSPRLKTFKGNFSKLKWALDISLKEIDKN